jgi:hypothetical protein
VSLLATERGLAQLSGSSGWLSLTPCSNVVGSEFTAPAPGHSSLETMTEEFYYEPSESIYQHYAWANNGKVSLCNDSDGEYEQVFGSREELQRFIDHLMEIANKAWPN